MMDMIGQIKQRIIKEFLRGKGQLLGFVQLDLENI